MDKEKLSDRESAINNYYVPPVGWHEIYPSFPMSWKIFDNKDKDGNLLSGSRKIIFADGIGHCLVKD